MVLIVSFLCIGVEAQTRKPNIVFIFADDLGYGDTGIYGSDVIQTPNIDALARDGVRFTQGYVSHPVCSPSRAGLLTGRYQQRHGWEFNPAGRDSAVGLDLEQRTIADELKSLGYTTGMVGKWHLGQANDYHPLSRGFDSYFRGACRGITISRGIARGRGLRTKWCTSPALECSVSWQRTSPG